MLPKSWKGRVQYDCISLNPTPLASTLSIVPLCTVTCSGSLKVTASSSKGSLIMRLDLPILLTISQVPIKRRSGRGNSLAKLTLLVDTLIGMPVLKGRKKRKVVFHSFIFQVLLITYRAFEALLRHFDELLCRRHRNQKRCVQLGPGPPLESVEDAWQCWLLHASNTDIE